MSTQTATWCETCGNPVENGKCCCWGMVADALQRYLGMDFDASAQMAADLWDAADTEDKARVWSAEYADNHDVTTYPDERGFAPKAVRDQDAIEHEHDTPCPRCGRRQWTDENAQDTCQACGYEMTMDDVR
jgi:hypothetical protein